MKRAIAGQKLPTAGAPELGYCDAALLFGTGPINLLP